MKRIAILGSTGSIGTNTLAVIDALGPGYEVFALAAGKSVDALAAQARRYRPKLVCAFDGLAARELAMMVPHGTRALGPGVEGLIEMASHPDVDVVVMSLVGSVGFAPLIAALKTGKTVAVANKEPFVMAGPALMKEAERWEATVVPVDSEPSAVFQCLTGAAPAPGRVSLPKLGTKVKKVLLTASGGPFYKRKGSLRSVTVREALAHPRWKMGPKITVDSATLMNKGFEAIELQALFALKPEQVETVIHPQSVLHSAVELKDGSVLGQLAPPDMRGPIQLAITWPERAPGCAPRLDLFSVGRLDFDRPDFRKFPCLALAREAARVGGTMPAVLSAADEVAVEAFLTGRLGFTEIPKVIERTMKRHSPYASPSLADIVETDQWAREAATACLGEKNLLHSS